MKPPSDIWGKITNYFKARPGCPTPEEMKKRILIAKAKAAAKAAGLEVYDPKCIQEHLEACEKKSDKLSACGRLKKLQKEKEKKCTIPPVKQKCGRRSYSTCGFLDQTFEIKKDSDEEEYVARIYQVVLTKIGIRNALLENREDPKDPLTICQICRVMPKSVVQNGITYYDPPDVSDQFFLPQDEE